MANNGNGFLLRRQLDLHMKNHKKISWEIAFRQQAIAEYHTFELLRREINREGIENNELEAVCLMLLQMVIEKLFKSACAQITNKEPRHDHAQVIFLVINVIKKMKDQNNVNSLRLNKDIVSLIHKLGVYHPHADFECSIEDGQFEYPWQTPQGTICYPAKDITFLG